MICIRILNWNIQSGGGNRILSELTKDNTDVIVISEFRNNENGDKIKKILKRAGFEHIVHNDDRNNKNGVLIASKYEIKESNIPQFYKRHLFIPIQIKNINLIGIFCNDDNTTRECINHIIKFSEGIIKTQTIITGDFNAGPRGSNPERYTGLTKMVKIGFVDCWRRTSSENYEWSYSLGNKKSQPDHFFITPLLENKIVDIKYDHEVRINRISDHSKMIGEFNL
ncbi:endonuclease/exonuclease/phosphatase family protein [Clostridium estertheticum]|uniref:endonuclease/exonuclease/phosphatase family protein n=1 Tax=Clostridium estertheticum TaxID=238834 RepID=UPI001C6E122F|nr:endonuclease/exonuclease/phosphatase family protein [Clostridium estertheticum]MBW9153940.1 endonuclease/exonuclease/phosphatase family protein [Clostridium estertheticum]WLC85573.1 endonuclease/exonuclease/phosphatase family protein [Clostridium estertheticum]